MRLLSTTQFIHLIVTIQSFRIGRVIKHNSIPNIELYSIASVWIFTIQQFLCFILNIDYTNDWNMLAKPIRVVMMEKSQWIIGS